MSIKLGVQKKHKSNFQVNGLFVWHVTFLVFDFCKVLFFPHYLQFAIEATTGEPPSGTKDGENFHGKAKKIQGAWLQALAPENLGKMLLSKLKKNC